MKAWINKCGLKFIMYSLAYCWELYADVATTSTAIYQKEKTILFNIVIVTVVVDRLINGRPTFTPLSLVFG